MHYYLISFCPNVGENDKGLKFPFYHEVRVSFLKKAVDNIKKTREI